VTLHESPCAACRQVGGQANQIVLWPLGGVAYVDPPPRPAQPLWSIARRALRECCALPILLGLVWLSGSLGWAQTMPDLYRLVDAVLSIDVVLLVFNILPIYPRMVAKIFRALLWFVLGRARSLAGGHDPRLIGVAGFIALPSGRGDLVRCHRRFMLNDCWSGFKHAQQLCVSPSCRAGMEVGLPPCKPLRRLAICEVRKCAQPFDFFQTQGSVLLFHAVYADEVLNAAPCMR